MIQFIAGIAIGMVVLLFAFIVYTVIVEDKRK